MKFEDSLSINDLIGQIEMCKHNLDEEDNLYSVYLTLNEINFLINLLNRCNVIQNETYVIK